MTYVVVDSFVWFGARSVTGPYDKFHIHKPSDRHNTFLVQLSCTYFPKFR